MQELAAIRGDSSLGVLNVVLLRCVPGCRREGAIMGDANAHVGLPYGLLAALLILVVLALLIRLKESAPPMQPVGLSGWIVRTVLLVVILAASSLR
jgi:hypothetical protein